MPICARIRDLPLPTGLAVLLWVAGASPLAAGESVLSGDGSGASNPGLLAGAPAGCDCALPAAPDEQGASFFDIDWSLALRGAWVGDGEGGRFEALAMPSVILAHKTLRGGYRLSADAEIAGGNPDDHRVGALRAGFAGDYRFDALTGLAGRLDLSLAQDGPDPTGDPAGTAVAPLIGSAAGEVAVTRAFGLFEATLRGNVGRTIHGPTTFNDGTTADNSDQDNWTAGAGIRLGYRVTPILTAFVDGSAGYQLYDEPAPAYLVKLDAADYALRTGLAARWTSVLEAEASVGVGLRRFAEPGFAEVVSALYDASLTFRPDETLTLGASFTTTVGAPGPDAGGVARVEYVAAADARYRVNPWLALRATAGWSHAALAGTGDSESGHEAGVGIDSPLNAYTALTADYAYSWSADSGNLAGEAEHRVTLGVTFSRPRDPGAAE